LLVEIENAGNAATMIVGVVGIGIGAADAIGTGAVDATDVSAMIKT